MEKEKREKALQERGTKETNSTFFPSEQQPRQKNLNHRPLAAAAALLALAPSSTMAPHPLFSNFASALATMQPKQQQQQEQKRGALGGLPGAVAAAMNGAPMSGKAVAFK